MDWDGRTTREIIAEAVAFDNECRRRDVESDQPLAELKERHQQTERCKRGSDEPPVFTKMQRDVIGYTISLLRSEYRAHVAEELAKLRAEQSDVEEFLGTEFGKLDREIEHNRKQSMITNREVAALREELLGEIGAVRADAAIDRAHAPRGQVLTLPKFLKGRSDAA